MKLVVLISTLLLASLRPVSAQEITVAVASNFLPIAEKIVEQFEAGTGRDVVLVHGSTGQLFAQITNGAPYDVFLAADRQRPAELRRQGRTIAVKTYAIGRLVLVGQKPVDIENASEAFAGSRVALADPRVAPYGLEAPSAMA
ncbi:MAG: molybdate ABC transporter substrate-binding protein, partial [Boseongicola sp.]|nr:molybdate ABC transporter substrate-binding protein [Boseongicola sp.]